MNAMPDQNQLHGQVIEGYRVLEALGQGGFGRVFAAEAPGGRPVVLKFVPRNPAAERELLFEGLEGENVLPIEHAMTTEREFVLVMPRAERSLAEALSEVGGRFAEPQAVSVLVDVASALASLDGRVVHRDLKPENVLFWNGRWYLADFGIARYAEAATAAETFKMAGSGPYVAPERWRMQRATIKSDVYSLGVMAFQMLEGYLPFSGDLSAAHQTAAPPAMTTGSMAYQGLVLDCLEKVPDARPSPARVLTRLNALQVKPQGAFAALQAAGLEVARNNAAATSAASQVQAEEERRRAMTEAATRSLTRIANELREGVQTFAPSASISTDRQLLEVRLGNGTLRITRPQGIRNPKARVLYGTLPFTVMAYASISVMTSQVQRGYRGREHSLWYADLERENEFRWYELAFHVMWGQSTEIAPFSLTPNDDDAVGAILPMMHTHQVARTPVAIDQGDHEAFLDQWVGWLAAAASGGLHYPGTLPEGTVNNNWRR